MSPSHALAWLLIGGVVLDVVWQLADHPSKTTYSSRFYCVVVIARGIAILGLAIVVLA